MALPKRLKKFALIMGIFLGVVLLIHIGVNVFIKLRLPLIIDQRNDTAYDFKYGKLSFSIWDNSISVEDISINPKAGVDIKKDIDFIGDLQKISVTGVDFIKLFRDQNLKATAIVLVEPRVSVYQPQKRDTLKTTSKLGSVIDIDRISIQRANLKRMTSDGKKRIQEIYNLNIEVKGVHMGQYTQEKDIPFTYTDFVIQCDSVFSQMNEFQHIKVNSVAVSPSQFDLHSFRVIPEVNSKTFNRQNTSSNTRLQVEVPKLSLVGTDWGYDKEDFYLKIAAINIDSIQFHILDQKQQTVFQSAKRQAESVIQPLIPFRLDIDQINVKKSFFKSLDMLEVDNVNISVKKISNRVMEHLWIGEVVLKNPVFTHYPQKSTKNLKDAPRGKLDDHIQIEQFKIEDAHYILKQADKRTTALEVKNFNLTLHQIEIDDASIRQKVPFTYKRPTLSTGQIHYNSGRFYDLYSKGIQIAKNQIEIQNIEMKPKYSRTKHVSMLRLADDIFSIRSKKIKLTDWSWGFDAKEVFYLKARKVVLNEIYANIFRNTTPPPDRSFSKMYSKKLRELPFGLEILQLQIVNSQLEYEEVDDKALAPGKLTFSRFNAQIQNVYSGYGRKTAPTTAIQVDTRFMEAAPLKAQWTFNIMNTRERFNIKGTINDFPAVAMNPFIKPYIKVSAAGTIKTVNFDFSGNDDYAVGSFGMQYDDLKMTFYRKDGQAKRRLLSAVGNLMIRNDTKGTTKETQIKPVQRAKESSFFNYLWLCILQGLKQTVL